MVTKSQFQAMFEKTLKMGTKNRRSLIPKECGLVWLICVESNGSILCCFLVEPDNSQNNDVSGERDQQSSIRNVRKTKVIFKNS